MTEPPPVVNESDKPFYLAIGISIVTTLFGVLLVSGKVDATEAQSVFSFFSGLMALSWGHYFGTAARNAHK